MAEVLNRHKDVQYSSRIASHIARQQQAQVETMAQAAE
jgi:NTE family protein